MQSARIHEWWLQFAIKFTLRRFVGASWIKEITKKICLDDSGTALADEIPEGNKKLKGKNMNKGIGIALLVVGIILIIYGFDASESVSSGVSHAFTGTPSEKTLGLLLSGAAAMTVGGFITFRGSRPV